MANVLHVVGHIRNFRSFCSSSCGPSPACLSHALPRLPRLYHLIWADDRQGNEGGHRWALGLWVQLPKAVRILPAHPLNEDLPLWSFCVVRDFSKSTTCFPRSPEQKLLFVGMKSMAETFPFVPSTFKSILILSHPHIPWHCSKPPLCVPLHHVTTVCFSVVYAMPSLMFWKASPVLLGSNTLSLSPICPDLPRLPFLKIQFEVSYNILPYPAPILAYPVLPDRAKPSSSFLITSRMLSITNLSILPRVTGLVYKTLCQK